MARILLVDKNREYLFMLRDVVEQSGHIVLCATEFETAICFAQQSHIQLVLLNPTLGTGAITGLDLAHALAIIDPTLPVVMLGIMQWDLNIPIMEALGLKMLTNPVGSGDLKKAIRRYSRAAASYL
jgi:DNA-binding response OmpR family regulator